MLNSKHRHMKPDLLTQWLCEAARSGNPKLDRGPEASALRRRRRLVLDEDVDLRNLQVHRKRLVARLGARALVGEALQRGQRGLGGSRRNDANACTGHGCLREHTAWEKLHPKADCRGDVVLWRAKLQQLVVSSILLGLARQLALTQCEDLHLDRHALTYAFS